MRKMPGIDVVPPLTVMPVQIANKPHGHTNSPGVILKESSGILICRTGYVNGAAETLDFESVICVPYKVSQGQIGRIVQKFLTDHPDRLHRSRSVLTVTALVIAYPCESED